MRRLPIIIGVLVVLVVIGLSSVFTVDERQQALVLQFGKVKQVKTEPGLGFKIPFIQNVVYYEGRILPLDTKPLEVTPLDERRLVVDAFARWRISDPVEFRQAVQSVSQAELRLEGILNASLRQVLGSVPSADVLSPERTVLMTRIRDAARESAEGLGVEIIDVRIRRADLPQQNLDATFERMNAERQREAADERARGKERAQEVRATADRKAVELVSDAERQADIIRGKADAERNRIYAEAYGRDPEFFAFYRSLQAYKTALTGNNSTMVITPDSEFFEYLKSPAPEPVSPPVPPTSTAPAPPAEPQSSGGNPGAGSQSSGQGGGAAAAPTADAGQAGAAPAASRPAAEPVPSAGPREAAAMPAPAAAVTDPDAAPQEPAAAAQ